MADKSRKLHVVIRAGRASGRLVRVSVCRADEAERRSELLSSTDGIMAMETRRPGVERRAFWRVVGTRELEVDTISTPSSAARVAFFGLAEPDVFAIHVVNTDGEEVTFIRDCAAWLEAPRFPHPVYRVAPERT